MPRALRMLIMPRSRRYAQKPGLPPAAADILLFLANNPGCETAGAICRMRGLKPAIVSFHIDRLVSEGFLRGSLSQATGARRHSC